MNEDQLQKLTDEVLGGDYLPDPDIERQWIAEQTAILRVQEHQMIAAYRLHKFMRKEGDMNRVASDLKNTREMLAYLANRLTEIGG